MALQLALAVGGLVAGSLVAGAKARSQQRKASRLQQRLQERQARRERLSQVREAQVQRARIIASGAATGALEGSAVQGGAASVQTQAASNIAFINQSEGIQQGIASANRRASDAAGTAQALGQVAGLVSSFSGAPTTG